MPNKYFPKMFEKGYIGTCQLKNRVFMTSMLTFFGDKDMLPSNQLIAYYEERAKGGVGLIMSEASNVNLVHGASGPRSLYALDPFNIQSFARVATAVHKYGTKIFGQLNHGGANLNPADNGGRVVAQSAVQTAVGLMPEALTIEEIEELKQQYIMSAVMLKLADYDGVEIHAAHGYLMCEFFSPAFNKREDQYGGSRENRVRIVTDIIAGIKYACGADFPVAVRMSVDEYDPTHPDAIDLKEGVEIAKLLEAAGADALDISCGNYFSVRGESLEPFSFPEAWRSGNTKAVKEAVKIPVIGMNTIKQPATAERLLEERYCDFVGVGRGHIADPEWVRKAKAGKTDEIRKCLGCLYCFESLFSVAYPRCSVNPRMSREWVLRTPPEKNGNGRKVAVVGGGAAGMQASALLAERGFDVTLFEKKAELGGALKYAAGTAPYKDRIQWFSDTLQLECEKAGVDIRTNTEATVDSVKALNPEAVFLSVGGNPVRPASIPGINAKNVVMYQEVLDKKVELSGKIALIGGGLTGLETAEFVCHNYNPEKLYIVDMLPQIGTGIYPGIFADIMYQIMPYAPEMLAGHALAAVTDTGVNLIKLEDQSPVELAVDYVVLAMGVSTPKAVIKEFEDNFDRVVLLGETNKAPGRIAVSVADGYLNAYGFDPDC